MCVMCTRLPTHAGSSLTPKPAACLPACFCACQACKTAKTNLMRLSAGLHGLNASVGVVDCQQSANRPWCYQEDQCLPIESLQQATQVDEEQTSLEQLWHASGPEPPSAELNLPLSHANCVASVLPAGQ